MRTGVVDSPLHNGTAPYWLFKRMVRLAKGISEVLIDEFGVDDFVKRLANPFWFQSFGCVLGFDWHSSGLTTTTTAALKLALRNNRLIHICGGKGKSAFKTPDELLINPFNDDEETINNLIYTSKLTSKIDNACIQDGYKLYHHTFIHTITKKWVVIQQGMNNQYARRYHWYSSKIKDFFRERNEIVGVKSKSPVLDMTSNISANARKLSVELINDNPKTLIKYLNMPKHHDIINLTKQDEAVIKKAYEIQPKNYEELISINGFGPKKIRALALVSELIYGKEVSWKDPVKYSFAHGGKDGYPFPVDKKVYDNTILTLKEALDKAKVDNKDKLKAMKKLHLLFFS